MSSPLDPLSSPSHARLEEGTEAVLAVPPPRPQRDAAGPARHEVTAWTGVADDGVCPVPPSRVAQATATTTRPSPSRADVDAFGVLDAPLAQLARDFPDGDADDFRARHWHGFQVASTDARLNAALGRLSREEARELLAAKVHACWPTLSGDEAEALTGALADSMATGLRQRSAYAMRDTAVRMMREAAVDFDATATSPATLCDATDQLAMLERPGAEAADRAQARQLRDALGLADGAEPVTPDAMADTLRARARLLRAEANELVEAGEGTIYRRMARQDLRAVVLREAGIAPGSWAEAQLAAVKHEGERQEANLERARLASAVVLAFASGGLGLSGAAATAAGVGMHGSLSAAEALVKWKEIDSAAAAESAGTRGAGATREARAEALHAGLEVVLASVAAGGAAKAAHHQVARLGRKLGSEVLVEGAAHFALHETAAAATKGALHVLSPVPSAAPASGRTGLDRLSATEER